jgi:hypothetical protein
MHHNTQKITATRACRRDYTHTAGAEDCKTRERERRREEEKRAVVSGLSVNRAAAASLQPRGSLPTVDTQISVFYVSRRLLIGNLWTWNLVFTSGFRTCPRYLNSEPVLDIWILDLSLIPGVQDLLLTPGFGTLFKLWVVVFGMSILGYLDFLRIFIFDLTSQQGWMD